MEMNISPVMEQDFEYLVSHYNFEELNFKKILITGTTGLIGRQIVFFLMYLVLKKNMKIAVIGIVRNIDKAKEIFANYLGIVDLQFITADIVEFNLPNDEIDYIIHGASITSSDLIYTNPVETIDISVNGTFNILRYAMQCNVKGLVYLSSVEAYGKVINNNSLLLENEYGYIDVNSPRSSYSESKRMCECLCSCFASEYALPVNIVRLTQTIGPGMDYHDPRITGQFIRSIIEGKDIVLNTDGSSSKAIVYSRDAISAIFTVLLKGGKGETYNVSNPSTFCSIKNTAELLVKELSEGKIKVKYNITSARMYAPTTMINMSTDKLISHGWSSSVNLLDAYKRIISDILYRKQQIDL